MNDILLIIPAFNEAENIERVVDEITAEHPQLDYVIINDGSEDDIDEICRRKGYHVVDHPQNMGLAAAFHTGMVYAKEHGYPYAIQFDGDGQHRPEFILPMREKMEEGFNIVIASRFIRGRKPFTLRMLGSDLIELAILLTTGKVIKDPTSGMRMYDRDLIEKFAGDFILPPEPSTLARLIREGAKVAEIPAVMAERIGGVSYLNPGRAVRYMWKVLGDILWKR